MQIEQDVMIEKQNFFDQSVKMTYYNIKKISSGQGNDCTTSCLIDDPYSKEH